MNFFSTHKKTLPPLAVVGLLALGLQPVSANSVFSTDSTVTLTFNSITSSSSNTSGLSISGLFEIGVPTNDPFAQPPATLGFGNTFTGDGQSSYSYTGAALPLTVNAGDSFIQSFSASGGSGNGTINSYYQSYGTFDFANNSASDTYTINFSLDYSLDAFATGSASQSQASIDYSDDLGFIFGSDQATANAQNNTHSTKNPGALTFNMVLNPGDSNIFYADIALTGSAASTSPVPLPATLWLFLSAVIGLRGYKSRAIQAHS